MRVSRDVWDDESDEAPGRKAGCEKLGTETSPGIPDNGSYWNYRLYREQSGDTAEITIREVYYDASGRPSGVTERGVGPMGESIEELREDIAKMMAAFDFPIVSDADFTGAHEAADA